MNLVNDDVRDSPKIVVLFQHFKQHSSSAEDQPALGRALRLAADGVSDTVPDGLTSFLGDPLGHADGRDPPRLRAYDVGAATLAGSEHLIQEKLRDLCRLAAARASCNHRDVAGCNGPHQ